MIKKLLETSLGNWSDTMFSIKGKYIPDREVVELIKKQCNPYQTEDNGGVLVYFSKEDFERLKRSMDIGE